MNALTVLFVAALAACSSGQFLHYPGIYGYPGLLPAAAPLTLKSVTDTDGTLNSVAHHYSVAPFAPLAPVEYRSQDQLGQYSFGYADGPSSRAETRDASGTVRGSYNYVDPEGKIQTQQYVADSLGFRVSGTNLPVAPEALVAAPLALPGPVPEPVEDTPEVVAAKAAHQVAYNAAAAGAPLALPGPVPEPVEDTPEVAAAKAAHQVAHDEAARKKRYAPLRFSYGLSSPLTYAHPAVAPFAPLAPVEYRSQDQLGQYSFGYADGPSSRAETRDAFGTVRGSYNYVDSEGKIQTQQYVAGALGFRVSGTNLPVAAEAPVAAPLALPGPVPEPVEDTPEVVAAKAAHQVAYDAAAAGAPLALPGPVPVPVEDTPEVAAAKAAHQVAHDEAARKKRYAPLRFSYGLSSPLTYGHPAVVAAPLQYTATAAHPAFATYAHATHPAFTTYAAAAAVPKDADVQVVHHPNHAVSYRFD